MILTVPDLTAASPRQREALEAYIKGGSTKKAAVILGTTDQAVRHLLTKLYRATGTRNAAEAAYWLGRSTDVP